ncbi:lysophospholipid acyltransferase family protein [Mycolicibacterium sediminis]|uniref:Membrane protein n=1 Tax=Mycolicibacterium sediminis TaxID=1286180 RepID=A0A7I7QZF7_9MYCO|nr:lysophospholipid acyltransferase family protein [Mycolicibacterium sediminis]BBY31783.1 membrane protein [Mycolicibacterium sediminis]
MRPPFAPVPVEPSAASLEALMHDGRRVRMLRRCLEDVDDGLRPVVDLTRPYVEGRHLLPRDGRFLLVGNHTQAGSPEVVLISHFVRRELGRRVRVLAERQIAQMRGAAADFVDAYGGVLGHPDTAGELMENGETVLVFPGGAREIAKFKGEEYSLRWHGRSGFARVAIANAYSIVPVALVGGDDVYRSVVTRDSPIGRATLAVADRLTGRSDMAPPLIRGIGPTLIPRPQRMYLRFGAPIDTSAPVGTPATTWEQDVKLTVQSAVEQALDDLLAIRKTDPFRALNPLSWRSAVTPAAVGS